MFKKSTLTVLTALVAGTAIFGTTGASVAKEPVRAIGSTQPGAGYSRYDELVKDIYFHENVANDARVRVIGHKQQIRHLNARIEALEEEAKDPNKASLASALTKAANAFRGLVKDIERSVAEDTVLFLDSLDDRDTAEKTLKEEGYYFERNPWPSIIVNRAPSYSLWEPKEKPVSPSHLTTGNQMQTTLPAPVQTETPQAEFEPVKTEDAVEGPKLNIGIGFGYPHNYIHDYYPEQIFEPHPVHVEHNPPAHSVPHETAETSVPSEHGEVEPALTRDHGLEKTAERKAAARKKAKKAQARKIRNSKLQKKRHAKKNKLRKNRKLRNSRKLKKNRKLRNSRKLKKNRKLRNSRKLRKNRKLRNSRKLRKNRKLRTARVNKRAFRANSRRQVQRSRRMGGNQRIRRSRKTRR